MTVCFFYYFPEKRRWKKKEVALGVSNERKSRRRGHGRLRTTHPRSGQGMVVGGFAGGFGEEKKRCSLQLKGGEWMDVAKPLMSTKSRVFRFKR